MSLKQTIQEDAKQALLKRESVKADTLRLLLAALVNKEKEAGRTEDLSDEEVQQIVSFEAKKRRESIEAFEKGGRKELAEKEQQELEVLFAYLPEQLSEQEITKLAKEAIAKTKATEPKDMGKVMGELAPQTKGKADGSKVSKVVKELLS